MIDHASGLSHDDLGEQTTVNYSYCEEPQRKCSGTWYQFKDEGHDNGHHGSFRGPKYRFRSNQFSI